MKFHPKVNDDIRGQFKDRIIDDLSLWPSGQKQNKNKWGQTRRINKDHAQEASKNSPKPFMITCQVNVTQGYDVKR